MTKTINKPAPNQASSNAQDSKDTELTVQIDDHQAPTQTMLLAHKITLFGYFGLFLLIPLWNLWWYPSTSFSNGIITGLWLFPLVFPMIGLIKGKAYTHAWSGFIAVIYVCHGFGSLITHFDQLIPIVLEIILSCMFLFGGMYFAKWRGEQLGLQLPKKK